MNIGLFTDTFFPQINGVATSVHLLQKELAALGHNVYIFTTTDPRATPESHIFRMPSMPFAFLPSHRVGLLYSPKQLIKMRKLKLDLVHTHTEFSLGIFGKIVAEFLRVPLVHTYHTMWEEYVHYVAGGRFITPKGARKFSKFFCNRADFVIAPANKAKEYLLSYGVGRPIEVIPTGIDFGPFSPKHYCANEINELKWDLGILPGDPVLLSVGRVGREKSMDIIIKQMPAILAALPNAKLVIVGDGPARAELQELARKLNIENTVIFTGARPWQEIGKYYQLGDAFINASVTETQGLTYVEAMAAHLPVVAKFDKSIEGLIHHDETGFTFANDEDLAALAVRVLCDDAARARVAAAALAAIDHLSSQNFGQNVARLYENVLATPHKPAKWRRIVRLKMRR